MRRGLLLAGVWTLGVVVAVTLAFAAVGRVASGVAPHDVARLSQTAIDDELTARTARSPAGSTSSSGTVSSSTSTSTSSTTTTSPTTLHTSFTVAPPLTSSPTSSSPPPASTVTTATTSPPPPPPVAPHNTVTTSQGGTVFTRCSGPDTIVYVAAVPRTGYERTVDVEASTGIQQSFVNAHHRSKIEAECSNGVVHAQVEEESADD